MVLSVKNGLFARDDVRETITNTEESSVAWDFDYVRYDGQYDTTLVTPVGIYISPDGLKMFVVDQEAPVEVKAYTLSAPWDITSATLTESEDVSAQAVATAVFFKPDGYKMYCSSSMELHEYNLATAWDVTTSAFVAAVNYAGDGLAGVEGIYFREDGKLLLVPCYTNDIIAQYIFTTPWDVSTMEYVTEVAITNPYGLFASRDGNYIFWNDNTGTINRWAMTSVFMINTAAADTTHVPVPAGNVRGMTFSYNGSKMYLLIGSVIQQYSIKRGWK